MANQINVYSSGVTRNNNYGTVEGRSERLPSLTSPRRVIYCVHGKPSDGCCRVLESEVMDNESQNNDIASIAKENVDTSELGSYL